MLSIGLTGCTGCTGLDGIAGFARLAGICAAIYFTGLVDAAGLAGLPDLIGSTGFAGLLALSAFLIPERIELPHPRTFLVVPPGRRLTVAGVPGVEADQVGATGCELLGYRVCFGGGEG